MRQFGVMFIAVLMPLAGAQVSAADVSKPTDERQQALLHLLKHDCGSCHGMTMKGGLGPALTVQALEHKDDQQLILTISEGHKGTAMPPWKGILNQVEIAWLVSQLRSGVKEQH